jgi:hypothetical protein
MARVKFGSPVSDVRGTIGGTTFSANGTSRYARQWRSPRRHGTRLASKTRCVWSTHGTPWRDLTQSQRDDWAAYAADPAQALTNSLGETYYASAWNWFVTINQRLEWMERSTLSSPPSVAKPSAPTLSSVTLEASGGGDTSAVNYPTDEFDGYDLVLFGRLWLSQGASQRTGGFYLILATQSPGASSTNVQSQLESVFGTIPEGARLFVQLSRQDEYGQRSTPAAGYGDS